MDMKNEWVLSVLSYFLGGSTQLDSFQRTNNYSLKQDCASAACIDMPVWDDQARTSQGNQRD